MNRRIIGETPQATAADRNREWANRVQLELDKIKDTLEADTELEAQQKTDIDIVLRRAAHCIARQRKDVTRTLSYDQAEVAAVLRLVSDILSFD